MIIDHIGAANLIYSEYLTLLSRHIGRIAFPIFAFLLAQSMIKTKNKLKLLYRLFLFAIISEIPFDIVFRNEINFLYQTNIFYTLFLGSLAIEIYQKIPNFGLLFLIFIAFIADFVSSDFGFIGIFYIFAFYYFYDKDIELNNFVIKSNLIVAIFGVSVLYIFYPTFFAFSLISCYFIYKHNYQLGIYNKYIKWAFYIFYPLHLVVLLFL